VGGSGLIVVVIVAAWALFLVPQWLHRRASAAAHLADRVPQADGDDETAVDDEAPAGRTFGRRQLARSRPRSPRRSRWRLRAPRRLLGDRDRPRATPPDLAHASRPDVPEVTSKETAVHPSGQRSAAARRRRVVVGLASLTLLAVLVVAVGAVASVAVPAGVVAVPGGLLVAYLVLLAVLRPGARVGTGHDRVVEVEPLPSIDDEAHETSTSGPGALVRAGDGAAHQGAERAPAATHAAAPHDTSSADPVSPGTWTPVPLPTPTYVTAPRARRAVRTIDLSNPGSWTASPWTATAEAEAAPSAGFLRSTPPDAASDPAGADHEGSEDYLERRRAVGD
jgi:hypothetical protein